LEAETIKNEELEEEMPNEKYTIKV